MTFSATSIFHLPRHVAAGKMKVRSPGDPRSKHFGTCRRLKIGSMGIEEVHTLLRCGQRPQQGSKRSAMHHAEAGVTSRLECQRVDLFPPRWHLA
jgi:hypothetical protein